MRKVENIIAIPSREAWIYEKPELIKQIREGLQEAKEGKTETLENLDKILDESWTSDWEVSSRYRGQVLNINFKNLVLFDYSNAYTW